MATSAQALADLQSQLASTSSVVDSAVTLIQTLLAAVQQANGVSPQAVEDTVAQFKAKTDALAAAVAQGTPAQP